MYPGPQYHRKRNPIETASFISKITFFYARYIFKTATKRELREDDIYQVTDELRVNSFYDTLEKNWNDEARKQHPSFTKTLIRSYGKVYLLYGLLQLLIKLPFFIIVPYSISKIVAYFSPSQTEITQNLVIVYALVFVFCQFVFTTYVHNYFILIQKLGLQIRVAISSLLYKKTLKLNNDGLAEITSGRIVTLISKDVHAFDAVLMFGNDLWIGVLQIIIMTYLMYLKIGVSAVIAITFFAIVIPLQVWLGIKTKDVRIESAKRTDQRLRLIQEILTTIKVIKMYTWEKWFNKSTILLRKNELKKLKHIFYIKTVLFSIANLNAKISMYLCFIFYIYFENNITAEKAFYVISCYSALRHVLSIAVPLSIGQMAEAKAASKRIKQCLLAKEVEPTIPVTNEKISIDVNANIGKIFNDTCTKAVQFSCKKGLIGITGPVGSGKSTLLKVILGEIKTSGHVSVSGTISYASQEPWIFPGTIQQNILFGQEYQKDRYNKVVSMCALEQDLKTFPQYDQTAVTDKGLNLSKGQQARINLARAVYLDRDIYLLDDILSALDATVSQHIFRKCIKKFLQDKLCILVTHNKYSLMHVDRVMVIDKNRIVSDAAPIKHDEDDLMPEEIVKDDNEIFIEHEIESRGNLTARFITEKEPLLEGKIIKTTAEIYGEHHKDGIVDFQMYKAYFGYAGGWKLIPILLLLFGLAQMFTLGFDLFVTKWVDVEEQRNLLIRTNQTNETGLETLEFIHDNASSLYSLIIILATISMTFASIIFFKLTLRASRELHNESFAKILTSHISFFDMNQSGNILNRFSKDVGTIDEYMPFILYECLRIVLILIGVVIVVGYTYFLLLLPTCMLVGVLLTARYYYLSTGRSLKRLDGITKAPVLGHLNASIDGLLTIRSNKVEDVLHSQFNDHLNTNASACFMYFMTNRAYGFFMDVFCCIYTLAILSTFIFIDTGSVAGKVGLAITQATSLMGLLQWGIRQWAEVENNMTSVERVMEYTNNKQEDFSGQEPLNWPKFGRIQFSNVSLKYTNSPDIVLNDVNFTIEPKQKVGIVGRTGAGKSSLISVLFKLYDIEGDIIIDGENIKDIEVELLRSKISIIPQDPILFSGTLRSNLDPFDNYTDLEIWRALKEVQLNGLVEDLPMGLQTEITENGNNFSMGQRHLICIARVILKQNSILVLDEATANVDPETDILIQSTIRRVFEHCTVLTIAHRLNTIMSSDKIMVIDGGTVVEFDQPQELLSNSNGIFYRMTQETTLHLPSNI